MESTINQRVREVLKNLGCTENSVASRLGIAQTTLNSALNSTKDNLSSKIIVGLKRNFPQVNIDWLLTGEGEMLRPDAKDAGDRAEMLGMPFPASTPEEGVSSVRFFSVTPSASFQDFCCNESERPEYIPVIAPPGEHIDESSCVFEVHGDSMLPQIPDHAKILCREISPSRWHQVYDGVVVIAYADRFVIKRVVKNRLAAEDFIVIGSDNPDCPGRETVARADIRCMFQARQILSSPIR